MNLNNLSYNLMFIFAFFAAITTSFFAFEVGVRPIMTILIRTLISFALFGVVGYLMGSYLKEEIISSIKKEEEKRKDEAQDEAMDEELPPLVLSNDNNTATENKDVDKEEAIVDETNQVVNDQPVKDTSVKSNADNSFDKVVIVNNDSD